MPAAAINQVSTINTEIILSERIVTSEWKVREIHENIVNRYVRADIEFGPFIEEEGGIGVTVLRGTSGRSINVWENEEYDLIRDTWTNADLLAKIQTVLEG